MYLVIESMCPDENVCIPSRFAIPYEFLSDDNSQSCERLAGLPPLRVRPAGTRHARSIRTLKPNFHSSC